MDKEGFINRINNDSIFLHKVAKLYLKTGNFDEVEKNLNIGPNSIQPAIDDDINLEACIDNAIFEEAKKQFNREGIFRIRKILTRLYNIVTSIEEDDAKAISQAAGILAKWYNPIISDKLKSTKQPDAEESEIDKLTKELENEQV